MGHASASLDPRQHRAELHAVDGRIVDVRLDALLVPAASDRRRSGREWRGLDPAETVEVLEAVLLGDDLEVSDDDDALYPFWLLLDRANAERPERAPREGRIDWPRAVRGRPVEDLLDGSDVREVLDNLVYWLRTRRYATWEAAIREEQGLALSAAQEACLERLMGQDDGPVLWIDELARPSGPWYTAVRRVAELLLEHPRRGWGELLEAIEAHAAGLELPEGIRTPLDVVDVAQRHALLVVERVVEGGRDPAEAAWVVEELQYVRESVDALGLTPASLSTLARVDPPEPFAAAVAAELGIRPGELLAPGLDS